MLLINAVNAAGRPVELFVKDGKIAAVGQDFSALAGEGETVLDAGGLTVLPAFVDLHCHWRTPGFEYKEDIATGSMAAAAGGYTFVNLMRAEAPEFEEKMGICAFPAVEGGLGDPSDLVGIAAPEWSISANTKYPEESLMLLQYLTCKEIAQEYADTTGAQSARNDVHSADPFVQKLEEMTANAANIQMVYDQNLPAELVDVHLSTTQEIFGQTMTAQEAADAVEAKAQEVLK